MRPTSRSRTPWRRATAGLAASLLLAGLALVTTATPAGAAVQLGLGHSTPAQPYRGNPDPTDWLGSYVVNGAHVWCVQFAHRAPDSDELYQPGEALRTKWGTDLPADVAADISYLLLRHATTTNADDAAALAHLLHSWTAAPQNPAQLAPDNDFRSIAYDAPFHLAQLPAQARAAVDRLRADAAANRGPWTAGVAAPADPQVIGTADTWNVTVAGAAGRGIAGVPVAVTVTDGTLPGGATTATVPTPADGSPLVLEVTPTGPAPRVAVTLASPADRPVVQQAIEVDAQRIVTTGGEKQLGAEAATTAVTAPGELAVTKIDETTGQPIAGVSLRITAADRVSPALDQQGAPLVGADGAPAVVVTAADGVAKVANLRTPQDVCVVEVAAPPGYDQHFDPASPPTACGAVAPGSVLAVTLANKRNTPSVLPRVIPAGEQGGVVATAAVVRGVDPAAVAALGGLVALALLTGAVLVTRHRRSARRLPR